jgi:hypothetical protein
MLANEPSKEELLKKLGIRPPTDEEIQKIVNNAFMNTYNGINESNEFDELTTLKNEVCEKLELFMMGQENVEKYVIETSVKYAKNNRYLCDYILKIKPKKICGILCKNINIEHIKKGMDRVITSVSSSHNYYLYTTSQSGTKSDNSTCIIVQSCVYIRKH